jgi:hypothetical protein
MDLALMKNFVFKEKRRLQFRAEGFNAANHTNFYIPGRSVGSPTFGVITSAAPARTMQLGLKFVY